MIVIDASVLLDVLLVVPGALALERRLFEPRVALHAPELLDLEVLQSLRRRVHRGELNEAAACLALETCQRLPIRRHRHGPLMERVWTLRDNLTAYDAAYVALAEGLGATLVTRDAALAGAAGHGASVELV